MTYNPAKGPCKDCTNRKLACHDHCEAYQEWKAIRNEAKHKQQLESSSQSLAGQARHNQYLRKYGRRRI